MTPYFTLTNPYSGLDAIRVLSFGMDVRNESKHYQTCQRLRAKRRNKSKAIK